MRIVPSGNLAIEPVAWSQINLEQAGGQTVGCCKPYYVPGSFLVIDQEHHFSLGMPSLALSLNAILQ